MSDNPKGKDGAARVFARIKQEYGIWKELNAEHIARWKKKPWSGHALVNIFVEGCRFPEAGYFNGHIMVYSFTLNLILAGLLISGTFLE